MSEEATELTIQLTEEDYYEAIKSHDKANGGWGRSVFMIIYISIMGIALLYNALFINTSFLTFIPIVVIVVILFSVRYMSKQRVKFNFRNDAAISKPFTLLLNKNELSGKSATDQWRLNWVDVYDYRITECSIVIYISPIKMIIIPERFITKLSDMEAISNCLHENVTIKPKPPNVIRYIRIGGLILVILTILVTLYMGYRSK